MSAGSLADRERQRQQALVEAVLGRDDAAPLQAWMQPRGLADGLDAYRRNAWAGAARALATSHPVTEALIGAEAFAQVARDLWRAHPSTQGDWSAWGRDLPAWLAACADLADFPYLADVARLDAACHAAEAAADRPFDAASLGLLGTQAPESLRVVLAPGAGLVCSAYPIVSLWQAHQAGAGAGEWTQARERLAATLAECAWVWRPGWRACCVPLAPAERPWMEALLEGASLAQALDRAGADFDFEDWLRRALADGSLRGLSRIPTGDLQ